MGMPVLRISGLTRHFGPPDRPIRAVDGVSFDIARGETLGLVGESGCGKTTLVRTILGLNEPTAGTIEIDGTDLSRASRQQRHRMRRQMQVVFQDPYQSFNPRMRVDRIISEPWVFHPDVVPVPERADRIVALLDQVGLRPEHARRYPGELSGGQRQRLGLARALALDPEVLVCDEPVSALDVSIQAQILNLIRRLRDERGLAVLFVAHDLSVVRHVSDRVMVMYCGKLVEVADTDALFAEARHPYTRALLSSIPIASPDQRDNRQRIRLYGDPPSPQDPPSGCSFRTRCWRALDRCAANTPPLESRIECEPHKSACFNP